MLKDYELDDDDYKPDDGVVMLKVNVLLIDFYDGAQLLFHWKTCESWCFLTSIVNLPVAYRGKLGISTFAEN